MRVLLTSLPIRSHLMPTMVPRAYGSQCGEPSPVSASPHLSPALEPGDRIPDLGLPDPKGVLCSLKDQKLAGRPLAVLLFAGEVRPPDRHLHRVVGELARPLGAGRLDRNAQAEATGDRRDFAHEPGGVERVDLTDLAAGEVDGIGHGALSFHRPGGRAARSGGSWLRRPCGICFRSRSLQARW